MMTLPGEEGEGKGSWQTAAATAALGKGQGKCETHATATATTSMTITKKADNKKKETQTKTKMKRYETKTHPDSTRFVFPLWKCTNMRAYGNPCERATQQRHILYTHKHLHSMCNAAATAELC